MVGNGPLQPLEFYDDEDEPFDDMPESDSDESDEESGTGTESKQISEDEDEEGEMGAEANKHDTLDQNEEDTSVEIAIEGDFKYVIAVRRSSGTDWHQPNCAGHKTVRRRVQYWFIDQNVELQY